MSISSLSNSFSSSGIYFEPQKRQSIPQNLMAGGQQDTVSLSSAAKEKYLAMVQEASEQARSGTQTFSTTEAVTNWYNEEFLSGDTTSSGQYSEWLPQNYQKFEEMLASNDLESTEESKFRMVFDALGKDKVITDQDIQEGIQAITSAMNAVDDSFSLDNIVVLAAEQTSQLQAKHQEEIRRAQQNLALWEDNN